MRHYEVLGVAPTATNKELRTAYLRLARRHHPDAGGSEVRMREINEAWSVLGHPTRRRAYDASLGRSTPPPPRRDDVEPEPDIVFAPPRVASPLTILPVAIFAASVASYCVGVVTSMRELLGVAFLLFCLSALLMVAMPFLELARSRRAARR